MKTKYIFAILLVSILNFTIEAANTYTVDQNYSISLTTGYVNGMSETWNVVSTVTDKTLVVSYSIGTENSYDFLTINNVDNSGNVTSQLLKISGTKSGVLSTTTPNGRVQVVFTSDGSICHANNPSLYSGISVSFSVNPNQIVGSGLFVNGDSYISGKLGVGKNSPQAQLDVTGINGGLAVTGNNLDPYFSNKLQPFQNSGKLILGWNYSGGRAEQDFIANSDTRYAGGFSFYNFPYGESTATHLMTLNAGGRVGIGTPTPSNKFEVVGSSANCFEAAGFYNDYAYGNTDKAEARINIGKIENNTTREPMGAIGAFPASNYDSNNGNLAFYTRNSQNMVERVRISKDGNVLIGTTLPDPTNALLTVNGTIHAKEINVTVDIPADYVFDPAYKLMPLSQVEEYVKANSHLPEIPGASEIAANGLSVGEMQNKLLQKIEELTLYVIEQQKEIDALKLQLQQK